MFEAISNNHEDVEGQRLQLYTAEEEDGETQPDRGEQVGEERSVSQRYNAVVEARWRRPDKPGLCRQQDHSRSTPAQQPHLDPPRLQALGHLQLAGLNPHTASFIRLNILLILFGPEFHCIVNMLIVTFNVLSTQLTGGINCFHTPQG